MRGVEGFFLFLFVAFFLAKNNANNSANNATNDTAKTDLENTLEFIDSAQTMQENYYLSKFNESQRYAPEMILIIGNTGAGKTTLVHYVASDYGQMEAVTGELGEIEIRDKLDPDYGKITSMWESRTFIPEIVIDEDEHVWCDCPGFEDTRNETVEIATSVMIKKAIEKVSMIKIVLVVDIKSVLNPSYRNDFDDLVSRVSDLIHDVEQLSDSISLVATKVPMLSHEQEKLWLATICKNLKAYRTLLEEKGSNEKKVRIISSILDQSTGYNNCSSISLFYHPNETGSFDKMRAMVDGRKEIRETILNNTHFVNINRSSIGFPLSPKARVKVSEITQLTIERINTIQSSVTDHLMNEINTIVSSIADFESRLNLIESGKLCILSESYDALTVDQFNQRIMNLVRTFNITTIGSDKLSQMLQNEKNLKTLKSITKSAGTSSTLQLSTIESRSNLMRFSYLFSDLEDKAQYEMKIKADTIIKDISDILTTIDGQLLIEINSRLDAVVDFQRKLELLQLGKPCMQPNDEVPSLANIVDTFSCFIDNLNVTSIGKGSLDEAIQLESHFRILDSLTSGLIFPIYELSRNSSTFSYNIYTDNNSKYNWYSFYKETFDVLTRYDKLNSPEKIVSGAADFQRVWKRVSFPTELTPTSSNMEELNNIITLASNSLRSNCSEQNVTIHGNFVKSCDIIRYLKVENRCSATKIVVYIMNMLYFDCDIEISGIEDIELQIFAPKWNIFDKKEIRLKGIDGVSQAPPVGSATAGKPGNYGKHVGGFFGWANEIMNSQSLTIYQHGGNGGDGQDGTGSPDNTKVELKTRNYRYKVYNVKDYNLYNVLVERIHLETGLDDIEMVSKSRSTRNHVNALVLYQDDYVNSLYNFHVFQKCCGATGKGGPGGFGGRHGYSLFVQKGMDAENANSPKIITEAGQDGKGGKDGKVCVSNALEILAACEERTQTYLGEITALRIKINFDTKDIINARCPVNYTETTLQTPTSNIQPKELNVQTEILAYRNFLSGYVRNPVQMKAIEDTIQAIDSTLSKQSF